VQAEDHYVDVPTVFPLLRVLLISARYLEISPTEKLIAAKETASAASSEVYPTFSEGPSK
jgi:hypothetical protein